MIAAVVVATLVIIVITVLILVPVAVVLSKKRIWSDRLNVDVNVNVDITNPLHGNYLNYSN